LEPIEKIDPMRTFFTTLTFSLVLALTGCPKSKTSPAAAEPRPEKSTSPTPAPANASVAQAQPQIDACSLLTGPEIESIQGAAPTDTKASNHSQRGLTVSQCYFLLPVAANSIVVTLTQRADGPEARDPKESWTEIFHAEHDKAQEREEEKDKEKAKPENITGLGDEAFWSAQRFGGVLYVLKGSTYLSISVGGAGDQASKLQKSKSLSELILKHL
jgi:hypothetical protein